MDFSNAFNSVDRAALFREVRDRIPSIAAWMECSYSSRPIHHLADRSILSGCGVQQGDPLGPLGFALSLHPIVEKIKDHVPGLLINAWYLDDGTLCGTLDDLCAAFSIIEAEGPSRGLFLNRSKPLLHAPANFSDSHPLLSGIPITTEGFTLLCSPLSSSTFCEAMVLGRVIKVQEILFRVGDLQDS